ncbi:MAG: helix-turn-helix domain-containing protein, partial [Candidatus Tumulicola sp.]
AVENGEAGRALRLTAGETHVGWLRVLDDGATTAKPAQSTDLALLARLTAAAIAVELARRPDAPRGREAFWERLVDRVHSDADAIREDATASGIVPAAAYLAIALECEGGTEIAAVRGVAGDVFRTGDAEAGMLERATTLLVFVPAAREIDASNARTAAALLPKTVAKRSHDLHFSGGVGTVEPPATLYRSAEAARTALAIGRRVLGSGRVVSYDALGAYPLLYEGADLRRLQSFARSVLLPLREYDERHQTELERTLRLFFETGQNVKTAAARLNVHRHTVFYRLRQIADICACALESPHDQLTLRLAVAIDALHSP